MDSAIREVLRIWRTKPDDANLALTLARLVERAGGFGESSSEKTGPAEEIANKRLELLRSVADALEISIGGCGCCGSPWATITVGSVAVSRDRVF